MSLPFAAPKLIWEEGVWAAIFGDGIFLKKEFSSAETCKPSFEPCMDEWLGQISDCSRKLKRALEPISDSGFGDVVKHVPEQTWQEERESLLQIAISRDGWSSLLGSRIQQQFGNRLPMRRMT